MGEWLRTLYGSIDNRSSVPLAGLYVPSSQDGTVARTYTCLRCLGAYYLPVCLWLCPRNSFPLIVYHCFIHYFVIMFLMDLFSIHLPHSSWLFDRFGPSSATSTSSDVTSREVCVGRGQWAVLGRMTLWVTGWSRDVWSEVTWWLCPQRLPPHIHMRLGMQASPVYTDVMSLPLPLFLLLRGLEGSWKEIHVCVPGTIGEIN